MNTLRRWTTTVVASFDQMLSQIENHEALITSAIRDVQESAGRANAQLARVRRDGTAMRQRIEELRRQHEQWTERAVKTAALDEAKAIECLRRKKKLETDIADLETHEREHARSEKQLTADIAQIGERLAKLKQQRNLMRTRQSRAEAVALLQQEDSHVLGEIDEIFDRWEAKVAQYETLPSALATDQLEEEFVSAEEQVNLKAELEALIQQKS